MKGLFGAAWRLPDPVYRDLVGMLFNMRLPVLGLGIAFVGVSAVIAVNWNDRVAAVLAMLGVAVTLARVLVIEAFHGREDQLTQRSELRLWEVRYAAGSYAFAILLAVLNVYALTYHYPLLHMISVSLVFGFGAGIVSRISIRPVICMTSLALAVVPTTLGLIVHATSDYNMSLHTELFLVEALLVGGTAALSLQTIAHLYRSVVQSVTLRHDLTHLAKQDVLTGLPNRLLLRERFDQSIVPVAQARNLLALHFLDLDGFKAINDAYGHPMGDALLQQVSARLTGMVRAEDTVARLGGDEFVVVQAIVAHDSEAEMLARRIIRQLSAPYEIDGQPLRISVSIGIALAPEQGLDLERLVACADMALYRSKGDGKGRLHFCTPEDAAQALGEVA